MPDVTRLIAPDGTPITAIAAADVAGMGPATPFGPGMPLRPYDGYSTTPRSHDYQSGYNIASRPRHGERVAFDTLRGLVEAYDIAQMCIWHRIDSVRSLPWELVAAPWASGIDLSPYIEVGKAALFRPDRRMRFKPWLSKFLYDVLAYDAGALYRMRNNAGRAVGLKVVDGTTLAPLLDEYGDTPVALEPGQSAPPAFVQYANGVPWSWLTTDDLVYEPFRPTSGTPYGKAPIESILLNANTDMRFQMHFLERFTEGNIPEAFASSPEGWSPDQIKEFQDAWDAFLLGDQAAKHQIKWVPHGTNFAWSNEAVFDDKFSLLLMRKTAAAYHVTPQDLGFTEDVNRATSDTQEDNQFRIGDQPLLEHVEGILDGFLQEDLGLPLCFQFDTGREKEDRLNTAQADEIYINTGVISSSEVREKVYGLSEPDGQLVPRFVMSSRAGPIPLSALFAVAGPVDEENAAPEPGSALPHKPFTPIEGVAPQKPPATPPLAVQRYPEDNPAAADASISRDLTAATPTPVTAAAPVGKSATAVDAELAAFRRFIGARRKGSRWRDFTFTSLGPVMAHRLNDAGRAVVRKDTGLVIAAGLAVVAADTGRVLMLQRGLDPEDPAAGAWEFPGGHVEDDESPFDAAVREWFEETGLVLPDGQSGGAWASADGIYQGFVWIIAREGALDLSQRVPGVNPDDPDGDNIEQVAWWSLDQIGGLGADGRYWHNPALRSELVDSLPAVLDRLSASPDPVVTAPNEGDQDVCPCGVPVVFDDIDGWQHADGSISHDDGESVSDKMPAVVKAGDEPGPKAGAAARRRRRRTTTT